MCVLRPKLIYQIPKHHTLTHTEGQVRAANPPTWREVTWRVVEDLQRITPYTVLIILNIHGELEP